MDFLRWVGGGVIVGIVDWVGLWWFRAESLFGEGVEGYCVGDVGSEPGGLVVGADERDG